VIGTALPHRFMPAVNINERLGNKPVSILVMHYTGMESAALACDWLCREESQVSCHYLVDEQGHITQMVDEAARAWHAGVSSWHGEEDINSLSIGIEIQNPGHGLGYRAFPHKQMETVAALSKDIAARHNIKPRNVLAHSDVAPGRKIDPGEKFDWHFLHSQGVGHYVEPEAISGGSFLQEGDQGDPVFALQAMLKLYGYGIEANSTFDARTRVVVEAFQRHFRQARVDGIADPSTVATLHRLLRQF
jgi:N-acetylmuramoyl-L-alanine amidase